MKFIGNSDLQKNGLLAQQQAENSHLPFRRMRSLQKFAGVHPSVHSHTN